MSLEEQRNFLLTEIVRLEKDGKVFTASYVRNVELPIIERLLYKHVKSDTIKQDVINKINENEF